MTSGNARLLAVRLAVVLLLATCGRGTAAALPDFAPTDRILVLAPHPDDEVLGCGGVLQRAIARGIPVEVAFLTYGDSNAWSFLTYRLHPVLEPSAVRKMGEVRRQEALAAAAVLGVAADRLTFLGYPDGGTLGLWTSHWGAAHPPGRGHLTRARAVPYATALRPGAPYRGEEVLADLEGLIARFRPTQVFVSHPADRHPDHAALYLFTRVALWDLAGSVSATLHPYLVHFPGWPARGYRPAEPATPPPALVTAAAAWQSWNLTPGEVEVKRHALAAHRSQWRSGERHLLPFARSTEITGEVKGELPEDEPGRLEVRRAGDRVEIALALDDAQPGPVGSSLFLFGYRADRPFVAMPKLELRLRSSGWAVLDQGRALPGHPITVERRAGRLILGIPAALLGGPDRLLLGARVSGGERERSPDLSSWRVVDLAPRGSPFTSPG